LTLPFAALGALVAAILETSVFSELRVVGASVDLVLVLAVVATMIMGVEDGLVWASLGGLMLDMLIPARPLGATTLALLLVTGLAMLASRILGPSRTRAVVSAFVLTWPFHVLVLGALVITEGVTPRGFDPRLVLVAAVLNTLIGIPAAVVFQAVDRRFGPAERAEW
jgi:hypothetical protein